METVDQDTTAGLAASAAPAPEIALETSGISKQFAGVHALTDVSVRVRAGEVHALLGENGAGKSTLMNVATGVLAPDAGTITLLGQEFAALTPVAATEAGIAIVHQHPAVLPDLTVLENLRLALPASAFAGTDIATRAREILSGVGLSLDLRERVDALTIAQKHLLEVAKALAVRPRILVLDEPTAPLGQESVDLLFARVRAAVAEGTAVIYITHRLAEVRELADRVTVLRDGRVTGTATVADITDQALLAMIVGRTLESTFPDKLGPTVAAPNLVVTGLSGEGFDDVSFSAVPGEIVGLAGVVGNGQSHLLRALAGLVPFEGEVRVADAAASTHDLIQRAAYLPADRPREGVFATLSVRENAAISALKRFSRFAFLSGREESRTVGDTLDSLAVKAASTESSVSSLSGGNQQKVVLARALLSQPLILIADEPTQGVDVGARAEIYRILREVSASGIPVIVNSSDAKELEGLCDQVLVLSRGHVVETLRDDEIREERIVEAAVAATATRTDASTGLIVQPVSRWTRFLRGDYAPSLLLVVVMIALGAYIFAQNDRYLAPFNISSMLMLAAALGFVALGQTMALLIGGIDLSVGPLAGFLVVVASFFLVDEQPAGMWILGLVLMLGLAVVVGLFNGGLITAGKFTAIAATLVTYIALQGVSLILRPTPGGFISSSITQVVTLQVGPIPVVFLVLVVVTLALEFGLRFRRWGWRLRAAGSDLPAARKVGVRTTATTVAAYVACSSMTFLGALVFMAQIGVGDALQGIGYTLTSITAVVLGGTSLLGGRGTFVGTLLGSVILVQVLNATVFLGLSQMWQYIFQGALILAAAVLYSIVRVRRRQRATA